jgi:hypothetical protein
MKKTLTFFILFSVIILAAAFGVAWFGFLGYGIDSWISQNPSPAPGQEPSPGAGPEPISSAPHISSTASSTSSVGAIMAIAGSGFTGDNTILFNSQTAVRHVPSSTLADGSQQISFTIPSYLTANCQSNQPCPMYAVQVTPGNYTISVQNEHGVSNPIIVSITGAAPGPGPAPSGNQVIKKIGEQEFNFLIQKINADSVDGLWYTWYPVARDEGTAKTLRAGDQVGYVCTGKTAVVSAIDAAHGQVTFTETVTNPPVGGCPICLASNTLIATPSGSVIVKDLRQGDMVWSEDSLGHRIVAPVKIVSSTEVPRDHQVVDLVLADGRQVFVSFNHPTIYGKPVGLLAPGDWYDGSQVHSSLLVPYWDTRTYDLLPESDTGAYWANGILLKSTLK